MFVLIAFMFKSDCVERFLPLIYTLSVFQNIVAHSQALKHHLKSEQSPTSSGENGKPNSRYSNTLLGQLAMKKT